MYSVNGKEFGLLQEMMPHCEELRAERIPYIVKYFNTKIDEFNGVGFAIEVNTSKETTVSGKKVPEGVWYLTETGVTKSFEESLKFERWIDAKSKVEEFEDYNAHINRVYFRVVTEYK